MMELILFDLEYFEEMEKYLSDNIMEIFLECVEIGV